MEDIHPQEQCCGMEDVNPRYVAYAAAHGHTLEEMMAIDEDRWPGGNACGFILWMSVMERRFRQLHPEAYVGTYIHDQKAWTEYLQRNEERLTLDDSARVRPCSGEIRHHDKHGDVEVLCTWGPRACKVRVMATGKREILLDENLQPISQP